MHTQTLSAGATLALALLVAGCAGNGEGLDASGQPLVAGGGANAPLIADFDSIQVHIFTPICSVCHSGAAAPHGLRLDATDSYHLLVGVPSDEVPSILRVKPGDPDNSYLIQKLEGHASVGARMPFGGPYLSSDTIAVIRQWITDGALAAETPAPASGASFMVVGVAPANGEILTSPPPQIMLALNHDLDSTRAGADSVVLEQTQAAGAGGPSAASMGGMLVPSGVGIPAGNPRTLMLWPRRALAPGHYQVIVRTAAALALADLEGSPLRPAGLGQDAANPADAVVSEFDVAERP